MRDEPEEQDNVLAVDGRRVFALESILLLAVAVDAFAAGAPEPAPISTGQRGGVLTSSGDTLRVILPDVEADDRSFNTDTFPILEAWYGATGVRLNLEAIPSNNYHDSVQTRFAARRDLPDIIVLGGFDLVKLANDGLIMRLNELMDAHAPNTTALFAQYPSVKRDLTAPDGSVFAFPGRVSPWDSQFSCLVLGYRLDWLVKLGLAEPVTIDDWHTMLIAFRDRDPNGNGVHDEIPFSAGGNNLYDFANAFGMSPWSDWFSVRDGKVGYDWTISWNQPKAKAYLATMRQWYAEGLIDQELLTDHGDKQDAQKIANIAGAGMNWNTSLDYFNAQMKRSVPGAHWVTAMPPIGPFGDRSYEIYPISNAERWVVLRQSTKPALATAMLDWILASPAGIRLRNFGVEGLTYTIKNGEPIFTDRILAETHYNDPWQALAALGDSRFPAFISKSMLAQLDSRNMSPDSLSRLAAASRYFRVFFPWVMATNDESSRLSARLTDIESYQQEMMFKFIVGAEPLSAYDAFVDRLKSMGIDEVVRIKQQQYDRYMRS